MTTSDTTRRLRGEYAKSAQRRKEIIAAAVEVFSESGFRDGSLRTVAERAGMTHAGMRHHFPTKVDLLEAVLQWREEDALERARRGHPVGIDVIRAWVASVDENTGTPALVELEAILAAEAISSDHPAHKYFSDLYGRAEDLLTKAFATMADRGELRAEISPDVAARLLLSTTLGLQSLWLRKRSIDIAAELRTYTSVLLTVEL
ncbi:TetR/AcrR family transcriptional regulator [Microbacterium sp. NPDC019599]|uniref:TetR/AcrR family transcriptional regulator n=1 Tax=Microbacterium sp. NPDC019599 TaxID=3154690 RepID=UPI00340541BD